MRDTEAAPAAGAADEAPPPAGRGAELAARAAALLEEMGEGTPLWSRQNGLRILAFAVGAGAYALLGYLLMEGYHEYRGLVWYGLYACPSHMLISPFPHEPALFEAAKYYPAILIAITGTIGCCVAGIFDYLLLTPLLHSRWVRRKVREVSILGKTLAFFYKWPFWMLVIAAYTPVPFYPFKFLAILGGYPLARYELALVLGRFPRFFTFAVIGGLVMPPTWLLLVFAFFGFVFFFVGVLRQRFKKRAVAPEQVQVLGAASGGEQRAE